jgi:hypothetical protein
LLSALDITADDVEVVLIASLQDLARVGTYPITSLERYAQTVFNELTPDEVRQVRKAAVEAGSDLVDNQLPAAYRKLRSILVGNGVLLH